MYASDVWFLHGIKQSVHDLRIFINISETADTSYLILVFLILWLLVSHCFQMREIAWFKNLVYTVSQTPFPLLSHQMFSFI